MPESAIVLMTAYGGPDVVQGAMERGAYCAIDKPFDMQDVDSMVRNAHRATRIHEGFPRSDARPVAGSATVSALGS